MKKNDENVSADPIVRYAINRNAKNDEVFEVMANLKKNAKGYYRKTFTYEGIRYDVYAKKKNILLDKIALKIEEIEAEKENEDNPTLFDYYDQFTEARLKEQKGATIRAQKSQFRNMAYTKMSNGVLFGDMRIKDITGRDVKAVRQLLLNEGKSPENLNICFSHLTYVFDTAVLDDLIFSNPCKALRKLKRESELVSETKHRALTDEEVAAFFKTSMERQSFYHNCFVIMFYTGMRIGELGALYLTDIDDKHIKIRRTITRDEFGEYKVGNDTKTYSGMRNFPIDLFREEIESAIRNQKRLNSDIFGKDWTGTLFQSSEHGLLREYTINREINRVCKAAGIEKFTCHAFRASFATNYLNEHPDQYATLARLLGHSNPATTFKSYVRCRDQDIQKIVEMKQVKTS